ncbi:hypothetical protein E2I00_009240, partial [Balaenoptera physalus]
VVQRIKAVEGQTRLLVVDKETDEELRRRQLTCTEEMAQRGLPPAHDPWEPKPDWARGGSLSSEVAQKEELTGEELEKGEVVVVGSLVLSLSRRAGHACDLDPVGPRVSPGGDGIPVGDEGAHPPCPVGGRAEVGVQAPRALLALSASVSSCPGQGGGGGQGRTRMWLAPPFRGLSGLSVVTQPRSDWAGVAAAAVQLIVTVMMGDRPEQRRGSQRCQGCRGMIDSGPSSPSQPAHASTSSSGGLWGLRRVTAWYRTRCLQEGFWGSLVPAPHPPVSCSRTVLCSEVRVPSFASLSPQPWVLGAGQGLPAVSFLPFLGRKPGRWGTPGWSLRRGGGLSHHPAPQSDSALCLHPSLGSLGHSGRSIAITSHQRDQLGPGERLNGGSVCSSRSDLPDLDKDTEDGSTWKRDPFQESGLHLSPTAAEAKEKVRATRVNKRAPQMDWNRKREIFSNF